MCKRGMLVHRSSRLGAAATVLAAEIPCGDGVFTEWAFEHGKAAHLFYDVMSHSFNYRRSSWTYSELKLPSAPVTSETTGACTYPPVKDCK